MANAPKQNNPAMPRPFFGALDGFRGLLAVFVAIYHTYWPSKLNRSAFLENGPVIIDLFFVFSGFLLFTLYRNSINTRSDAMGFFKRRFARLYPLHLFTLFLFFLFACSRVFMHAAGFATLDPGEVLPFQPGARESVYSLLTNLTMTHSMGLNDSLSFNVPSWTVSVEFFAYFTFAAMLIWAPPKRTAHFGLIGLGVVAVYAVLSQLKPNMDITYDFGFWRCMAGFYTGVIGAGIFSKIKHSKTVENMGQKTATAIELATVAMCTAFVIYCPGKLQFLVAPFVLTFVLVFAFDKGGVSKLMMTRLFKYLAKISYSVYMVHMLIAVVFNIIGSRILSNYFGADWTSMGLNGDLFLIPYLICVFIASHLTWKFVEMPGKKFVMGMKWPGKLRRAIFET